MQSGSDSWPSVRGRTTPDMRTSKFSHRAGTCARRRRIFLRRCGGWMPQASTSSSPIGFPNRDWGGRSMIVCGERLTRRRFLGLRTEWLALDHPGVQDIRIVADGKRLAEVDPVGANLVRPFFAGARIVDVVIVEVASLVQEVVASPGL